MYWNNLVSTRSSCRNYDKARKVNEAVLGEICTEALANCPSACNSQPWRIRLVCSAEKLPLALQAFHAPFMQDVTAIVVINEVRADLKAEVLARLGDSQHYASIDIGILTAHLALSATDHGVGNCIIGMFDSTILCSVLDIPSSEKPRLVLALGITDSSATLRPKTRKLITETLVIQ